MRCLVLSDVMRSWSIYRLLWLSSPGFSSLYRNTTFRHYCAIQLSIRPWTATSIFRRRLKLCSHKRRIPCAARPTLMSWLSYNTLQKQYGVEERDWPAYALFTKGTAAGGRPVAYSGDKKSSDALLKWLAAKTDAFFGLKARCCSLTWLTPATHTTCVLTCVCACCLLGCFYIHTLRRDVCCYSTNIGKAMLTLLTLLHAMRAQGQIKSFQDLAKQFMAADAAGRKALADRAAAEAAEASAANKVCPPLLTYRPETVCCAPSGRPGRHPC